MKVYFISFFFFSWKVTLSLLQGCPWTEHIPHTTLKKTDFRTLWKWELGSFLNLFWESKGMKLFMEWFSPPYLLSKKARLSKSLQFLSSYWNRNFYMKTIHTSLVVTTRINILWIIKYVCIKAKIFSRHLFSIMNYMFWESRLFPFV